MRVSDKSRTKKVSGMTVDEAMSISDKVKHLQESMMSKKSSVSMEKKSKAASKESQPSMH